LTNVEKSDMLNLEVKRFDRMIKTGLKYKSKSPYLYILQTH